MSAKDLPDPEYLRQRLRYDPETGKLYWREHESMPNHWNARYAGAIAGSTDSHGYVQVQVDGVRHLAHRVAWAMAHGKWPKEQIDHVNGDRTDNRLGNLREVAMRENARNKARYGNNTSGSVGVSWERHSCKWVAKIRRNTRQQHLGSFDRFEDAVAARQAAEQAYDFHPNHGRERVEVGRG